MHGISSSGQQRGGSSYYNSNSYGSYMNNQQPMYDPSMYANSNPYNMMMNPAAGSTYYSSTNPSAMSQLPNCPAGTPIPPQLNSNSAMFPFMNPALLGGASAAASANSSQAAPADENIGQQFPEQVPAGEHSKTATVVETVVPHPHKRGHVTRVTVTITKHVKATVKARRNRRRSSNEDNDDDDE